MHVPKYLIPPQALFPVDAQVPPRWTRQTFVIVELLHHEHVAKSPTHTCVAAAHVDSTHR
jgi:hypothetical protein